MQLIALAAVMISIFRGFWALRRRLLPSRTSGHGARFQSGRKHGLRLVASSEGLDRRAVTIACVGTTAELESLLVVLQRRGALTSVGDPSSTRQTPDPDPASEPQAES